MYVRRPWPCLIIQNGWNVLDGRPCFTIIPIAMEIYLCIGIGMNKMVHVSRTYSKCWLSTILPILSEGTNASHGRICDIAGPNHMAHPPPPSTVASINSINSIIFPLREDSLLQQAVYDMIHVLSSVVWLCVWLLIACMHVTGVMPVSCVLHIDHILAFSDCSSL